MPLDRIGVCSGFGEDAEVVADGALATGDALVDGAVEQARPSEGAFDDEGGGAATVQVDGLVSAGILEDEG